MSGSMEGWDRVGGGREVQEGGNIHVDVWQKPTQYCKAIIFQLKKNLVCVKGIGPHPTYLYSVHEQNKLVSENIFLLTWIAI